MNSYRSVAARIVKRIQALAASRGLLVMRYSESNYLTPHLTKAINTFQIDTVIDVGANLGQTVDELRASGFDGKIVSFEPTPGLFRALVAKHGSDPGWTGHQLALGSEPGQMLLRRYSSEDFNSFLTPSDYGAERFGTLGEGVVREEAVTIARLDDVWCDLIPSGRVLLKIDTQGFDLEVIAGAAASLKHVFAVLTEVPIAPIYEGMPRMVDVLTKMESHGFQLSGLFPISLATDQTRLVEANCVFLRALAP